MVIQKSNNFVHFLHLVFSLQAMGTYNKNLLRLLATEVSLASLLMLTELMEVYYCSICSVYGLS